ncbi:hypothetical protein CPAR01_01712 [Colletotrichum paranaense]|uniref:Uncharacterized protein n=1 Tax=Colletotrichum paranaense TaxID=1914294 RepID=A0ABQ9T7X9_9PEZI|nr:uncharacterized protein CPAR01_01712 [Colletotrichum paranaense]KAK1547745.1 hypothetical protein CPAR01_01712 [Colletotrichum paranaense]
MFMRKHPSPSTTGLVPEHEALTSETARVCHRLNLHRARAGAGALPFILDPRPSIVTSWSPKKRHTAIILWLSSPSSSYVASGTTISPDGFGLVDADHTIMTLSPAVFFNDLITVPFGC